MITRDEVKEINQCKRDGCWSYAINDHKDSGLCDKCFWIVQAEQKDSCIATLTAKLTESISTEQHNRLIEVLRTRHEAELVIMRKRLAEAQRDAERYRFLKKGRGCDIELMELNPDDGDYYGVRLVKGNYIDNKIDEAMARSAADGD